MDVDSISERVQKHIKKSLIMLQKKLSSEEQELMQQHGIEKISRLFVVSQYALHTAISWPLLFVEAVLQGCPEEEFMSLQTIDQLKQEVNTATDEKQLMSILRFFRHRNMLQILWHHINQVDPIERTMEKLTILADTCLDTALRWLHAHLKKRYGAPYGKSGPQEMTILGMGKLGGRELNFSSDVDLIFVYPENGTTQGGSKEIDNQLFFNKLGQALIEVIEKITEEGFLYRVDMRLRPFGNSGALTWSFNAARNYYQYHGRDWERYAMIKARPVAGNLTSGYALLHTLQPFIYRRYLDFSAMNAIRNMKSMIQEKLQRNSMENNIKLGAGGIREIEFIAQSFQLIYGGKKTKLQQCGLLETLNSLTEVGFFTKQESKRLRECYLFMRELEHFLQIWEDKQNHTIPSNQFKLDVLTWGMGFSSNNLLMEQLKEHKRFVENLFNELIIVPHTQHKYDKKWSDLWDGKLNDEESITLLRERNFFRSKEIYKIILQLKNSIKNRDELSQKRIHHFIPAFLHVCEKQNHPEIAFLNSFPIIEKVTGRTTYLIMLLENPGALKYLIKTCAENVWVAKKIASLPMLIVEFINPYQLYQAPSLEVLKDNLSYQLEHLKTDEDIESKIEMLCHFKIANILRTTIAQVNHSIHIREVSTYLSWIAESIINETANIAWDLIVKKYGLPDSVYEENDRPFIIVGYGKLGSMEMNLDSDLDLVFIHNTDPQKYTTGEHAIDNQTFFARFTQKLIQLLSTQTVLGNLYEVDVRLRPSGNSGLLVSTMSAFCNYQKNAAWTWETQALIKARVVTGTSKPLCTEFSDIRSAVLEKKRDKLTLQKEIKDMRIKMQHLDTSNQEFFDVKYGRGSLVDMEFMIQFLVLYHTDSHKVLTQCTGNISLLEIMEKENILDSETEKRLKRIYFLFHQANYLGLLSGQKKWASIYNFISERNYVIELWNELMEDSVPLVEVTLLGQS